MRLALRMRTDEIVTGRVVLSSIYSFMSPIPAHHPKEEHTSSTSRSCAFWCCANNRALSSSWFRLCSAGSVVFFSFSKT